ncbi:MAG TPA: phosphoribosylaminoimidazolesuccinocarboxamide synthase [Vicinamibacterales bacterium]|nr:phosphoribosylaminoimidazolesuccinocarboxamide synthase [Vicinamibacterales bacterium]
MITTAPLLETHFAGLTLHGRGKVRDIYRVGDDLLIVTTDRISAFDYVLGSGIPDKGKVLNQLSAFWFDRMATLVPHHVLTIDADAFPPALRPHADVLRGRSMLVRRTRPVPIECVARGYLSGSGWKEYQQTGRVCGIELPKGLRESDRLPAPIFTPATKAESGHDENISADRAAAIVGRDLITRLRDLTLEIYRRGCAHAESKGIIIADTKLEFGLAPASPHSSRRSAEGAKADGANLIGDEEIVLIDEVLTPDSSRFWPKDEYRPGHGVPSFDKQYVRDYLEEIHWNKQPPVPSLPDPVVQRTREKYVEAFRRLSGGDLA